MDGIHDLGGKHGYGPIETDEEEEPFHADWEGREWGLAQCARTPGITIDWWRHCRELIPPIDYLDRPYFDSWAQTDLSAYMESGWISIDEIITGKSDVTNREYGKPPEAMSLQQVLDEDHDHAARFDAEIDCPPAFAIGQSVITAAHGHEGHTRLPQYARGHTATIHAHHGAHVFPDLSAKGEKIHQHLYTVMFSAVELWGGSAPGNDKIFLDLCESYLSKSGS